MGFTKDNDTQCTVYDPLQNGLVKKDKNALEVITKYVLYCIGCVEILDCLCCTDIILNF